MTISPTRVDERLDPDRIGAITGLMLEGRRISEVVAHGLSRSPGWRRQHVVDVVAEKGWTLDSDGRIPRGHRTSTITPVLRLGGAPVPAPPREPVAEWPEKGTVTEGPRVLGVRGEVGQLIAQAKQHESAKIRHRAQKAEDAIDALREALRADQQNDAARRRLAELDAEREKLLAQLGRKSRPKSSAAVTASSSGRGGNRTVSDATRAKPVNHGTWGGWLQEDKRDLLHCDACNAAKDAQLARMRAKSPLGKQKAAV